MCPEDTMSIGNKKLKNNFNGVATNFYLGKKLEKSYKFVKTGLLKRFGSEV